MVGVKFNQTSLWLEPSMCRTNCGAEHTHSPYIGTGVFVVYLQIVALETRTVFSIIYKLIEKHVYLNSFSQLVCFAGKIYKYC